MSKSIEDLALERAAYSGFRWSDLDKSGREHYRRLVEYEIERRKALETGQSTEPMQMPPFYR